MQPGVAVQRGSRVRTAVPAPALTALATAVGLAATAAILGTPYLLFGYHNPSLHLVLDSVDGCVAFLVAYLLWGRFTRSRRWQDLLLAQGLFLLGLAGVGVTLLVSHLALRPFTFDVWLQLALRSVGSGLLLAAALCGDRLVHGRLTVRGRLVPWLVLAALAVVLWLLRDALPLALDPSPPASAQRPVLEGHWLLLLAQALSALCFLVAAAWFTRQGGRREDELLRWLGPALVLGGFARANYVLFPSLYSDWVYTGDLLRTGCYLLLLVGAGREISQFWSAQTRVAVLDDRRRLARELHDGVVQELGYIRAQAHGLDGTRRGTILAACDRALDEARAAVDALGRSPDEPLGFVLHRAARQVAERYGGRVVVDVDDAVDAGAEQRHALVRVTREAVSNALRHGGASCVRIRLSSDATGRRLLVEDDGRGFDAEAVTGLGSQSTGYGLTSMRERAQALPGAFELRSAPGAGTTVGVTW